MVITVFADVTVIAPLPTPVLDPVDPSVVAPTPPTSPFEDAEPIVRAHLEWTHNLSFAMPTLDQQPANDQQLTVMGPIGPACKRLEIFWVGDGEKRACGLALDAEATGNCTIISIGSNKEWDFEEAVFDQLECFVETFDCTVLATVPPRIASRTRFHHVCAAGGDWVDPSSRVYRSWPSIISMLCLKNPPLYLKMDIEGAEYETITNILESTYFLPRQIAFEIHSGSKTLGAIAGFMESLYSRGGYFFIDHRPNTACSTCTEVLVSRMV
jgi:hypothetical protein